MDMEELRRKSQFTYRDLERLGKYSVETPLRVIAHIDLDAFYAQCETVRLGIDESEPLAVKQWENLIAINYPARALGLNARHVSAIEAKKLVPSLRLVHVATWKSGSTHWSYPEPGTEDINTSKACLDPYRMASKQILSIFRRNCEMVEKASVDESFLDLSKMVGERVQERYRDVLGVAPPYGDTTEKLPLPRMKDLEWSASTLVGFGEGEPSGEVAAEEGQKNLGQDGDVHEGRDMEGVETSEKQKCEYTEEEPLDWDDVCLAIAAEIVADIRGQVRQELKYTCSAGIARNKMLAKLASGYKKPNNQTVVRARAISQFLSGIKFTKIRNLGGKLGTQISEVFTTTHIPTLLTIPLPTLSAKLPPDTALWLYNAIRGIDRSEVNPRTLIKSMLSAKSFRPPLKAYKDGIGWMRVFAADICGRMREEGCLQPGGRRPKTLNLGWRGGGKTGWGAGGKSRGCTLPAAGDLSEDVLFKLAEGLLKGIPDWPCGNLSLTVGGFEESEGGRSIMSFLVRGEAAKHMRDTAEGGDEKRRRIEGNKGHEGIKRFLTAEGREEEDMDDVLEGGRGEEGYHDEDVDDDASDPDHEDHDPGDFNPSTIPPHDSTVPPPHTKPTASPNPQHPPTPPLPLPPSKAPSTSKPRFFSETPHAHSHSHSSSTPTPTPTPNPPPNPAEPPPTPHAPTHPCPKCHTDIPITEIAEHDDWHFAKELLEEERRAARGVAHSQTQTQTQTPTPHGAKGKRKGSRSGRKGEGSSASASTEKGQRKLAFGRAAEG